MNIRLRQSPLALLCATILLVLPTGASTQSNPTYTLKKGDTIVSVAEQFRPPEATVSQMALAIARANVQAFQVRTEQRLAPGTVLTLPSKGIVLATDPATAERDFARLWRAEQHYKAAVALERSKDMFYAFATYAEAAKLGHPLAQLRMGELYDSDFSGFVRHDLQESARWYEKAREQGVKTRTTRRGGELTK
jgi:LysM domain